MSTKSRYAIVWRVAIIMLIAVFSIAGLTSCGDVTTEPTSFSSSGGSAGPTVIKSDLPFWNNNHIPELPPKPTFPEDSYYTIYAPFVNWADKSEVPEENRIRVSWQDTNTVSEVWKKQIEGGKDNDGKRFIIRDANNYQREPVTGSYYFFDKNFNIVYYRQGKGSLLVRRFVMGIIVSYSNYIGGAKPDGNWGIGGVYQTVLSKKEITDNNFDQLNIFMGDRDMGETSGNLEVLILNTGYRFDNDTEFGVTFIYGDNVKTIDKLSAPITGIRNLSYVNYKFVSVDPYLWHLEDHSSQKGWKRE